MKPHIVCLVSKPGYEPTVVVFPKEGLEDFTRNLEVHAQQEVNFEETPQNQEQAVAMIKEARETIREFADEDDFEDSEIEDLDVSFDGILEALDMAEFAIWDALGCKPDRSKFEQALYFALSTMRNSRPT